MQKRLNPAHRFAHFQLSVCEGGCLLSNFQFYKHDHLGNTRLTYNARCLPATQSLLYTAITVHDYYPYGSSTARPPLVCDPPIYCPARHVARRTTFYPKLQQFYYLG